MNKIGRFFGNALDGMCLFDCEARFGIIVGASCGEAQAAGGQRFIHPLDAAATGSGLNTVKVR